MHDWRVKGSDGGGRSGAVVAAGRRGVLRGGEVRGGCEAPRPERGGLRGRVDASSGHVGGGAGRSRRRRSHARRASATLGLVMARAVSLLLPVLLLGCAQSGATQAPPVSLDA